MTTDAFFVPNGDAEFVATESTRGPWSPAHQHGGPPAALLARAVERALPSEPAMQLARLTVELLRPVPITRLVCTTQTLHVGRKLRLIDAVLREPDGKPLLLARGMAMRTTDITLPALPENPEPPVPPAGLTDFEFPFFQGGIGYHKAMQIRIARGRHGAGPVAAWMRMRVPLVAGESTSPLQRVVVAADSGNGLSALLDTRRYTFVNPDLTIHLHRLPMGEWIGLDAATRLETSGIGLADTRLFDERGVIGRSDQSLIIQPHG